MPQPPARHSPADPRQMAAALVAAVVSDGRMLSDIAL